jgi:hypothetical protein
MRIVLSMIDRKRRQTDEASRSQVGEMGRIISSGWLFSHLAPVALRSVATGPLVGAVETSWVDS